MNSLGLLACVVAVAGVAWKHVHPNVAATLVNVSDGAMRELFHDLDVKFIKAYEREAGVQLAVSQSHDRALADVVTVALPSDVNALARKGLIATGWSSRLPGHSQPYVSTIVFVVHRGNPKLVRDWQDLARRNVVVVTPDPKTSGSGKLGVLAAWGSVVHRGGSEAKARGYLKQVYAHASNSGGGGTLKAFMHENAGDVYLAWENEALVESAGCGNCEIVYPPSSIRAEPSVAWVDSVVSRRHTEAFAKAYLQFLFATDSQEMIAQHGYRPTDPVMLKKYASKFPSMDLFPVTAVAKDWDDAERKFFADGGIFDQVRPLPSPPAALALAGRN